MPSLIDDKLRVTADALQLAVRSTETDLSRHFIPYPAADDAGRARP